MGDRSQTEEIMDAKRRLHEGTIQGDGMHCERGECWCWEDRYMVVTRETSKQLAEAVNIFIHQKGWSPLGGIVFQYRDDNPLWAQAMVRHL